MHCMFNDHPTYCILCPLLLHLHVWKPTFVLTRELMLQCQLPLNSQLIYNAIFCLIHSKSIFFYLLLIIGIIRQSNTFYFQYNIYFKLSWGQFLAVEMVASEDQFPHYTSHASECHCTPVCVVCNYFYLKQISLDPGKHL